ncbi:MAG TPA: dihydrofolate reductase family protein, partial [Chitinophagaceae bacterium]|nr:dihydrofolate reductase family protein [Chitinophagaceae bacterium]
SLDGYIEGPNREIDWIKSDEAADEYLRDFSDQIDAILYGRVSYEMYLQYADQMPGEDYSRKMREMKKLVFSDTMEPAEGIEVVRSNQLISAITKLKLLPGKNIWLWGGSKLITAFINADLIDEYRVAVQPVILGAGNPLFQDITRMVNLELVKATPWPSGIVSLIYERRK